MRNLTVLMMALLVGCVLVTRDVCAKEKNAKSNDEGGIPAVNVKELINESKSIKDNFDEYKQFVEMNNESIKMTMEANPNPCPAGKAMLKDLAKKTESQNKEATTIMTNLVKKEIAKLDNQKDKDQITELNKMLDEIKTIAAAKPVKSDKADKKRKQ